MITTPDDLQWMLDYCLAERAHLARPFSQSGWTYATDGQIAVRIPLRDDVAISDTPEVWHLFETAFFDVPNHEFQPLPALALPRRVLSRPLCPDCKGSRKVHDCPSCNCQCATCLGLGRISTDSDDNASVTFAWGILSMTNVRRLMALSAVRIAPPGGLLPIPFHFSGGQGLVMPMRGAYRNNVDAREARAA